MAYGIRKLRKIQLAKETTKGTSTAATTVWGGTGVMKDDRGIIVVDEDRGFLLPSDRIYSPKSDAIITFDPVAATFEQLPYILAAGVEAIVTGTADTTTGSGKIYTYDLATNAEIAFKSFTLECGDNIIEDDCPYAFVERFTLSGRQNEAVMMSATWRANQAVASTFTASQTVPTVEEILFNKCAFKLDATGGTIGSTQVDDYLRGFTLDWVTGHQPVPAADGNLYYGNTKQAPPVITGTLSTEVVTTTTAAEITAARAGTVRLIRLLISGTGLTTAANYTYKTLKIDLAIQYTDVPSLGEADGDDIIDWPFRVVYVAGDSLGGQIIVVNEVATLP